MTAEPAKRCARSQKQSICRRLRAAVLEILHDRLADFTAQRQSHLTTTLATDVYPRVFPVDITQTHLHDVAGPQPQPCEQKQDRTITLPGGRGRVAGLNDALDILRW